MDHAPIGIATGAIWRIIAGLWWVHRSLQRFKQLFEEKPRDFSLFFSGNPQLSFGVV
jgi:hypothetical protein